jgi:MoaA/NifB/PqqE/SkfB family radical SAM enzyme
MKKISVLPDDISIEVTNVCNSDCIMCPRKKMERKLAAMDKNLFKKIINEIQYKDSMIIRLNFNGEFLTLPLKDIEWFLKYIRQKNSKIKIVITTNGSLLDERVAKILFKYNVNYIRISLDAFYKETYEKIRRNLDYNTVLNNVVNLIKLKKSLRLKTPIIYLCFVEMKINKKEKKDFFNFWSSLVDNINFLPCWERECTKKKKNIKRRPCYRLWNQLIICNDGLVSQCVNDWNCRNPLGDIKKQSLKEIWASKKMDGLREDHLENRQNNLILCKTCYPEIWDKEYSPKHWFDNNQ